MQTKKQTFSMAAAICFFILSLSIGTAFQAQAALTVGKTYDKTNYQEIQELLIPPVLQWVKKGEFILKTGKLEYEFKKNDKFLAASLKNEGKYDINKDQLMVDKSSGKLITYYYGYPFPKIDGNDKMTSEKIIENMKSLQSNEGSFEGSTQMVYWLGPTRLEREIGPGGRYLHYMNREKGSIPNPNGFKMQNLVFVVKPFDLRGTIQMSWSYLDNREDSCWAYVPMLRRVRRTSGSTRSDPFLGSDFCLDDNAGFDGKTGSMRYKLLGEKTVLIPFTSTKMRAYTENPDGTFAYPMINVKKGIEVPGWKGAAWAAPDLTWVPKTVYLVEMTAKDPYYNYGRHILYIDKQSSCCFFKEIYDKSGQYWKSILYSTSLVSGPKRDFLGLSEFLLAIDDRAHHASWNVNPPDRLDNSKLRSDNFTESAMVQYSK